MHELNWATNWGTNHVFACCYGGARGGWTMINRHDDWALDGVWRISKMSRLTAWFEPITHVSLLETGANNGLPTNK